MTSPVSRRDPVTELSARERAAAVLDPGTCRELIDPFDRVMSPHLVAQGITTQSDDGVVVARGTIDAVSAVVIALDGRFQGGGIGEVNGAKIAGSLELALGDAERGTPIRPVLFLETGGIRLQEANLGLLAIAEIHSAIAALRRHTPVVGVIAGMVGCFGGMGIVAGLCSDLIVTPQGRLGLNGPEVVEQEAGADEWDARDRARIWRTIGGSTRASTGLADVLVADDTDELREALRQIFRRGARPDHECRSALLDRALRHLSSADPAAGPDGEAARPWSPISEETPR